MARLHVRHQNWREPWHPHPRRRYPFLISSDNYIPKKMSQKCGSFSLRRFNDTAQVTICCHGNKFCFSKVPVRWKQKMERCTCYTIVDCHWNHIQKGCSTAKDLHFYLYFHPLSWRGMSYRTFFFWNSFTVRSKIFPAAKLDSFSENWPKLALARTKQVESLIAVSFWINGLFWTRNVFCENELFACCVTLRSKPRRTGKNCPAKHQMVQWSSQMKPKKTVPSQN